MTMQALWTIIHIIDILLWIFMAVSVGYVLFFALASLLPNKNHKKNDTPESGIQRSFLVLFPAYNEDNVILQSVKTFLQQRYPKEKYHVAVISDHMSDKTNDDLGQLDITLLLPSFEHSSKAKAMQYAMTRCTGTYDHVVILDADNIVSPDFLQQLNRSCIRGYKAIQCHRCAKNSENDIAILDGVSEEINNTIFRKAHNRIGLSSALIGSGMCFEYDWFKDNVHKLNTAGEDREIEALLLRQGIYIKYEESIYVFDEKVNNKDNFERQRLRWMSAQINGLCHMLPYIPEAMTKGNKNILNKTIQQALVPRSILIVGTTLIALTMLIVFPQWSIKWWILLALICLSIIIAIPAGMRTKAVLCKLPPAPMLVWLMLKNISKIDKHNKHFTHTTHGK